MKIPKDIGFSAERSKRKVAVCLESPSENKDAGVWRQRSESGLGDEIRDQGGHRGEAAQAAIGTWTFTGNESEPLERSEQRRSSAGGTELSCFSRIVTNIHFSLGKSVGQFEETRSHSYHFSTLPLKDRNHIYTTGSFGNKD